MKQELGKWIFDVSKYIATAGIIAPFLSQGSSWYWFVILIIVDAILLISGLLLSQDGKKSKNRRK